MSVIRIVYYLLTICCLILSAYLSFWGYLYHVGWPMTGFFVAMIILGLFGIDIAIQVRRERGDSITLPMLFFLLPLSLSALSNFNHLYTLFKQRDVAAEAMALNTDAFTRDLTNTRAAILALPQYVEFEREKARLANALDQMSREASDPLKPGCAELCRGHMDRVREIAGGAMVDYRVPSPREGLPAFNEFFGRFSEAAQQTFQKSRTTQELQDIYRLLSDIDGYQRDFRSPPADAVQNVAATERWLRLMSARSNEIQNRANALGGIAVAHQTLDPLSGRLGKIPDSVRNAFVEMPDPAATFLSSAFALVIDLMPVLFVLMLIRPGDMKPGKPRTDSPLGQIM